MFEDENELITDDVPETSENEELIETDASEGVDEVQDSTEVEQTSEDILQKQEDDLQKQIEERANEIASQKVEARANEIAEEKIEARLIRDRVKREREDAKTKAKYEELERIMKSALGAENIDDVITKSKEFYRDQGISIPEIVNKQFVNERDEIVLAKADAGDIIKLGKSEMEAEANRIAAIPEKDRSLRDKTVFNDLCQELIKINDINNLTSKGYSPDVLSDKDFMSFREQFNFNTPVTKVYEMYQKVNDIKPTQPKSPGSAKTTLTNNEIKEYYTPDEVRKFSEEDLDNPKLMKAIEKSMQLWGKSK